MRINIQIIKKGWNPLNYETKAYVVYLYSQGEITSHVFFSARETYEFVEKTLKKYPQIPPMVRSLQKWKKRREEGVL